MIIKKILALMIVLLIFTGCSSKDGDLTRVDVQTVNEKGDFEEVYMITDDKKIKLLRESFREIKWEPNTMPKMTRKEDVLATLFYTYDKNMPERLFEYRIWFNSNDTATIISNKDKEGYGNLNKEETKILKDNLLE